MSPSMGLFSRRKASGDKNLRATMTAPHGDPYMHPHTSSSATAVNSLQQQITTFPRPPHSAPLPAYKRKALPNPKPIVSGYAANSVGLVFAPRLSRARTSTFDPPPSTRGSTPMIPRPPLNRSRSGPGRRSKSFDQRPPMESYQDFAEVSPLDPPEIQLPPVIRAGSSAPPNSPAAVNYNNPETPMKRIPTVSSATGTYRSQLYSPVSSIYPASPPLSPESVGESSSTGYEVHGTIDGPDYRTEYGLVLDTEAQHLAQTISRRAHDSSSRENETSQQSNHLSNLKNNCIAEAEHVKEGHSLELAALRLAAKNLETSNESSLEDLEHIQRLRRREFELVDAVKGKERELEFLRSNSNGYLEQIAVMERVLAQKDEELDNARIRIQELNQIQARRTSPMIEGLSEMGLADMGRKLMEEIRRREKAERKLAETIVKARSDLETVLTEEERKREDIRAAVWREFEQTLHNETRKRDEMQQKSNENLNYVLGEEEKRRAELNWHFGEKIESIERLRRSDLDEFNRNLAGLKEEKERLEKQVRENAEESERNRQSIRVQRDANEELLDMSKKINTRLGEEKKKNRQLEEKIKQITEDASNNVSGAAHEVVMLKNVIEDKDTKVQYLESELAAMKKENQAMKEGCASLEDELTEARRVLSDRDDRVKRLEEENSSVADRLEAYRKELNEFKEHVGAGEKRIRTPEFEDMKMMDLMKEDIELYKKDVRVYRKDVKKRDNQINELKKGISELESLLESKSLETKLLQDALDSLGTYREGSPASNCSSGSESIPKPHDETTALREKIRVYDKEYRALYEEHEAMKKKHDLFVSQQALIIAEMDKKLSRARKDKDTAEAQAAKQLRKMQNAFQQLSQNVVAGQLSSVSAVTRKYQEVPLPPTPQGLEYAPSSPKRSNTGMRRAGSKVKAGRRHSALSGDKIQIDLSPPFIPPVVRKPLARDGLRERARVETRRTVNEPDGAFGGDQEEIIEW